MTERTAVVLFTRDLRVHDQPALAAACANFERVVPLFVFDPSLAEISPNRSRFLRQSLADLRETLRGLGGDLAVRHGDPVAETIRLGSHPGPPPGVSGSPAAGGERIARRRLHDWLPTLERYADLHDDLAADGTSRLSPYLRFGCLSPLEVARQAADRVPEGREGPFTRQLCWRDFYYQVALAFPDLSTRPYRPGARDDWRYDDDTLAAWSQGRTGVPIVDVQVFFRWLLDGDVPNNSGNWQWVAGTGNDTKPS